MLPYRIPNVKLPMLAKFKIQSKRKEIKCAYGDLQISSENITVKFLDIDFPRKNEHENII